MMQNPDELLMCCLGVDLFNSGNWVSIIHYGKPIKGDSLNMQMFVNKCMFWRMSFVKYGYCLYLYYYAVPSKAAHEDMSQLGGGKCEV